jgi:signal transduction histidine kinase
MAALVQWWLWAWLEPNHFILFYPAVFAAAFVVGIYGGVAASLVSATLAIYFFIPPIYHLQVDKPTDWIPLFAFLAMSFSISWFIDFGRRRNADLHKAKEAAEKISKMRSQFLDIAAHELRTPVTTFSMLLQYSERQLQKGHPVEPSTLVRLRSQAARLSRLVADLFEVARLDHGSLVLNLEPTNLSSLILECLNEVRIREPERQVIFEEPPDVIELGMDRARIMQVLSNLLDNAVKYADPTVAIEVKVDVKCDFVRISVIDQSPGISKEQLKVLFEPLTRGTSNQVEQSSGLGLGLFISRGIVELHGGTIGVESVEGVGSTFYFDLPRPSQEKKVA